MFSFSTVFVERISGLGDFVLIFSQPPTTQMEPVGRIETDSGNPDLDDIKDSTGAP